MSKEYKFFKLLRTLYGLGMIKSEFKAQDLFLRNAFDLMTKQIPANLDRHLWFSLFVPSEIMHAMGAVAIESDTMGAYLASFGQASRVLGYVEQELGLVNVCSYHKALIGAVHQEIIPAPRAIIVCDNCCDSVRQLGTYFHDTFGSQLFIIDAPPQRTDASRFYLKRQLMDLTKFVEDVAGVRFSMDRLREAVRLSNEANHYWKRALDLRRGRPLLKGIQTISLFISIYTTFGTAAAVEVTRTFYEELLQRREHGPLPPEDGYRLMWFHNLPIYKSFLDRLEEEIGASVVVEVLSYPHQERLDEEDPFDSIADRILTHPVIATSDRRGPYCRQLAQDFQVDGAVQLMHLNCRGNYGISRCVSDSLGEVNIPLLSLDMDALDNRHYSEEQVKTRMQAFVESIQARREAAGRAPGATVEKP